MVPLNELIKAKEELRSSNFKKALIQFQKLLEKNDLTIEQRRECCHSIHSIFKFIQKPIDTKTLELLASNWEIVGDDKKASFCLNELYLRTRNLNFLERVFQCNLKKGEIEKAHKVAESYLQSSFKRGFSYRIKEFIEKNNAFFEKGSLLEWEIKAYLASGNKTATEAFVKKEQPLSSRLLNLLLGEVKKNTRFWHTSPDILKLTLEYYSSTNDPIDRKHLVKAIFDAWLNLDKDFELINKTLELAKKHSLNILGHELSKQLGKEKEMDYFASQETPETLNLDELDLGLDLLVEEKTEGQEERNIKFLIKSGLREEALKKIEALKKTDPQNPFVRAFEGKLKKEEIAEVGGIESLLKDIGRFTTLSNEDSLQEKNYSNLIKFYDKSFIEENYEDMVIGYNLLNLPLVALEILDSINYEDKGIEEKVNITYLKAESSLRLESFYEVRDIVDDALGNIPLSEFEKVSLVYLRAEAYYHLGDYSNALIDFKFIRKQSKNYRLTEERIKEIEKNK